MAQQIHGRFHHHLRKRIHHQHESFPSEDPQVRLVDKLVYVAGVFAPLVTLPQLLGVWVNKSADGVSLITWGSFTVIAAIFVAYGLLHKEKPILFTYSSLFVIDLLIVIGALMYGK